MSSVYFLLSKYIYVLYLFLASGVMLQHRRHSSADFDFNDNPLDQLHTDMKSLIERVVICQDQYEMPSEDEVTRVLSLAVSLTSLLYKNFKQKLVNTN